VRFTWYNSTSGQEQAIPYWREAVYDGANATFWVKVSEIPASQLQLQSTFTMGKARAHLHSQSRKSGKRHRARTEESNKKYGSVGKLNL